MGNRILALVDSCALGVSGAATAPAWAQTTLRVVNHSDLKIIDPVWTTAYIVRNHGYMIYDTLFAMDGKLEVKPEMVDKWTVSDDKLTWTFTLRDGLEFHDGKPVTSEDLRALRSSAGQRATRWAEADVLGRRGEGSRSQDLPDQLKEPDRHRAGGAGQALGQRLHHAQAGRRDRAFKQIEDYTGSGPFIFVKEEWKPGDKTVYVKNPKYKPRSDPPSGLAGAKIVKVDRVEWVAMTDPQTMLAPCRRARST